MRELALNAGSFTVQIPSTDKTCWLNIDILDLKNFSMQNGFNFLQHDIRRSLPFQDNSVNQINASHLLEHLEIEKEAVLFLKECWRVLKPGGVLRIGVPDLRKLIDAYLKGEMDKFYRSESFDHPAQPEEYLQAPSQADKFWRILTADHETCYDFKALETVLTLAGFLPANINLASYDKKTDMFPELSIYVIATKSDKPIMPPDISEQSVTLQPLTEEPSYKQYLQGKIKEGRQLL